MIEVASNDGYLLQHVIERGMPALGIEPAANVAAAARERGIETVVEFFGRDLAARLVADGRRADLLVANNVMAHVPDLNDFVRGIATVLTPEGVATIEVPHLMRLIDGNQFDTIYHEHFSYFSFLTAQAVLASHGLTVFDVDELPSRTEARCASTRKHGSQASSPFPTRCPSSPTSSARSATTPWRPI